MFVVAGIQTVTDRLKKYDQELAEKIICNFTNKGLISFGRDIKGKFPKNYIQSFEKTYKKITEFDCIEKYIDSGGYQIATQQIPKKYIDIYTDTYVEFLEKDNYDWAFSLDIPDNSEYKDVDELIKLNETALSKIKNSKANKDKILFVVHFRTLNLFEIWKNLTRYLDYFPNVSIGGLVVAQANMKNLPFLFSIVGVMMILSKWKEKSVKKAKFHVLGNSTYKDVIFYSLLRLRIKDVYGIDLDISYDSSNLFKKFQMARVMSYWDSENEKAYQISAKEKELNIKYDGRTANEIILSEVSNMVKIIGADTKFTTIYENEKFQDDISPYVLVIEAYEQVKFEKWVQENIDKYYQVYKDDSKSFITEISKLYHKIGAKNKKLPTIIKNTLDMVGETYDMQTIEKLLKNYSLITDSEYLDKAGTFNI